MNKDTLWWWEFWAHLGSIVLFAGGIAVKLVTIFMGFIEPVLNWVILITGTYVVIRFTISKIIGGKKWS